MFEALIARARSKLDIALKSAACAVVAGVALVLALAFFAVAGFVAAQHRFGAIPTALGFGGAFLLIAVVALLTIVVLRRSSRRARIAREARRAAAAPPWWLDPRIVAAGLELGKSLGGRRTMALGLAGAFVVGILLSRGVEPRGDDDKT